ncbi:hypothetical protein GCM10010399_06930 [Dactylosporangium fulvum]
MTEVNDRITPMNGAIECLRSLAQQGIRCHVFTNGPLDGQLRKLAVTGLGAMLDHVFVSEELGVAKPEPEAFRAVLERLAADPHDVVMIGDSMEMDILPGRSAGMHTLLYAPSSSTDDGPAVRTLAEVPDAIAALQ